MNKLTQAITLLLTLAIAIACSGDSNVNLPSATKQVSGKVEFYSSGISKARSKAGDFVYVVNLGTGEMFITTLNEDGSFSVEVSEGNLDIRAVSEESGTVRLLAPESDEELLLNLDSTVVASYVISTSDGYTTFDQGALESKLNETKSLLDNSEIYLSTSSSSAETRLEALGLLALKERIKDLTVTGQSEKIYDDTFVKESVSNEEQLSQYLDEVIEVVLEKNPDGIFIPAGDSDLMIKTKEEAARLELTVSLDSTKTNEIKETRFVPVASVDQTSISVRPGALVFFDGSGSSDKDGDTLNYAWSQKSGTEVLFSNATAKIQFRVPTEEGNLELEFKVDDGEFTSEVILVSIEVSNSAANQLPVANAGADQTTLPEETINLDGSLSLDYDSTLSYSWTQVSGPTISITSSSSVNPSFVAPSVKGDVVLKLTASDEDSSSEDTVTVNVSNSIPSAAIAFISSVEPNSTVLLDGSGSNDPDSDVLSFKWSQVSGESVVLSNELTSNPGFTAPSSAGNLEFSLVVDDQISKTSNTSITIPVLDPVQVSAGSNIEALVGDSFSLSASFDRSYTGDIAYEWMQLDGSPVTITGSSNSSMQATAPTEKGTMKFKVISTLNGLQSSSEVSVQAKGYFDGSFLHTWSGRKITVTPVLFREANDLTYSWKNKTTGMIVSTEKTVSIYAEVNSFDYDLELTVKDSTFNLEETGDFKLSEQSNASISLNEVLSLDAPTQLGNEGMRYAWGFSSNVVDGRLFYSAKDESHNIDLWVTDGTSEGTKKIKAMASHGYLREFKGEAYYISGGRLWKSDGTESGTVEVDSSISAYYFYFQTESKIYFGSSGKIYSYDGSSVLDETSSLIDGTRPAVRFHEEIAPDANLLYEKDYLLDELYFSDGASKNYIGEFSNFPSIVVSLNSKKLFLNGDGIWITDGTLSGTSNIKSFSTGAGANGFTLADNFGQKKILSGSHVFLTDGTSDGSKVIAVGETGEQISGVYRSFVGDDKFYIYGYTSTDGNGLFISDGTDSGTRVLKDSEGNTGGVMYNPSLLSQGTIFNDSFYFIDSNRDVRYVDSDGVLQNYSTETGFDEDAYFIDSLLDTLIIHAPNAVYGAKYKEEAQQN